MNVSRSQYQSETANDTTAAQVSVQHFFSCSFSRQQKAFRNPKEKRSPSTQLSRDFHNHPTSFGRLPCNNSEHTKTRSDHGVSLHGTARYIQTWTLSTAAQNESVSLPSHCCCYLTGDLIIEASQDPFSAPQRTSQRRRANQDKQEIPSSRLVVSRC